MPYGRYSMPRSNRRAIKRATRLRPVTSEKHYSLTLTGQIAVNTPTLVDSVTGVTGYIDYSVAGNEKLVPEGSHVYVIKNTIRVFGDAAAEPFAQAILMVRKNPDGLLPAPTVADLNAPTGLSWKKWIIYYARAEPGSIGGFPMGYPTLNLRRFKMSKFNKNDVLEYWMMTVANPCGVCGSIRYKHYI